MALKFLNKKGWHTGSLRNIETVWKAEQKHESEQKKLEELRKQIHDEREKSEFRLMQEQAGLVPRQERLEFLYDSGLQVGKVSQTDEYLLGKPVDEVVKPEDDVAKVAATPGALFVEEKPASANDSWRKLHSDPLFLIRQQEQAAIARIKSNPVKMAEIKKDAEMKKKQKDEKKMKRKEARRERKERKKKKIQASSSEDSSGSDEPVRKRSGHESDGDIEGKIRRRKRSPSSSSPQEESYRNPGTLRRDDIDPRGSKISERSYKGEGSRQDHREASERRHHESNNHDDSRHHERGCNRRDTYSKRAVGNRDQSRRHDSLGERSDLHHKQRSTDVCEHRDRDVGNAERRSGYDHDVGAPKTNNHNSGGWRRADEADNTRDRSYDHGSRVRTYTRESDYQHSKDYGRDKRQKVSHAEVMGISQSQEIDANREKDGQSSEECDTRLQTLKYSNSEGFHSKFSDDSGKRYGLIKDESTFQGRDQLQSSNHGPADDPRDRKLEVVDKAAVVRDASTGVQQTKPISKGRPPKPKPLSDAERAARLAEMQSNADIHEEQRWQRLKHAANADDAEGKRAENEKSNEQFMADTRKSMYGTEKFDSASTIEKSVKRRAHFIERSRGDGDKNSFRR